MTRPVLIQVPYHLGREGGRRHRQCARARRGAEDERRERSSRSSGDGESRNQTGASLRRSCGRSCRTSSARSSARAPSRSCSPATATARSGTVAGLDGGLGVVWLDAHADFHMPDTTTTRLLRRHGLSHAHRRRLADAPRPASTVSAPIDPSPRRPRRDARDPDAGESAMRLAGSRVRRSGLDGLAARPSTRSARGSTLSTSTSTSTCSTRPPAAPTPWAVDGGLTRRRA